MVMLWLRGERARGGAVVFGVATMGSRESNAPAYFLYKNGPGNCLLGSPPHGLRKKSSQEYTIKKV